MNTAIAPLARAVVVACPITAVFRGPGERRTRPETLAERLPGNGGVSSKLGRTLFRLISLLVPHYRIAFPANLGSGPGWLRSGVNSPPTPHYDRNDHKGRRAGRGEYHSLLLLPFSQEKLILLLPILINMNFDSINAGRWCEPRRLPCGETG